MESTTINARIAIPAPNEVPAESQGMLDAAEKMIGFVPNVLKVLAKSPNVLTAFLTLQNNLSTSLNLKTRTAISLAVSEVNACHYCLSAHSFFAEKAANVASEEILLNRKGQSEDEKVAAAAQFGARVVTYRGKVTDADLDEVRSFGYSDKEILEIIALSVQFTFTNFINNAAGTEIDFDVVTPPGSLS